MKSIRFVAWAILGQALAIAAMLLVFFPARHDVSADVLDCERYTILFDRSSVKMSGLPPLAPDFRMNLCLDSRSARVSVSRAWPLSKRMHREAPQACALPKAKRPAGSEDFRTSAWARAVARPPPPSIGIVHCEGA
ncbi:hypothetical protein [Burkholderia sp. A1]|uniref:hypothetical protein n=1 Tax=Burkholderia sp. A1 TaxID=148446 RepID=UPI00068B6DF2|nr:hypothetical protein [Burkholderia sp. A1]